MQATTPRRTDMSLPNSPSQSPSRRVLGDLTPKAINTPSKQTNTPGTMKPQSPLKQVQTLSPQVLVGKENDLAGGAYGTGRKRSIYEVDGAENVEDAKPVFGGRGVPVAKMQGPMAVGLLGGNVEPDSDDEDIPLGSPTEPNTPTPELEDDNLPVSQETSASKESFSMFLNYGACESQQSQGEDAAAAQPQSLPPIAEEKESKAELLRLRLGFGMYKIKTNQIKKSGAEILSTWETSSSSDSLNASTSTAITSSSASTNALPVPSITLSPARREPVTHVVANIDPSNSFPKLGTGPKLLPTTYSSRMVFDYSNPPSSPPVPSLQRQITSISPEQLMSPTKTTSYYRTPEPKRIRTEEDEAEDEEMDVDVEESVQQRLQRMREKRYLDGDLTSSVVKGHTATALLELMSGKR
ncbi:hypothetical protein BDV96DRAFT_99821 [Lophiotrema nucula]|uniref:Uncharacterized protein n=1 Tax=Lophiotrema nucula TaxID=690887 RepID=A0A6A5Z800_9PLEO|nr:hypothetical protein BDV96DRAFT_99821 [Lophiotrema nucula]